MALVVQNPPASAGDIGDAGSISGSGRFPGEENGNTLQYSCLENPMDRGAWWATVHGVAKSWTRLSDFTFTFMFTELIMGAILKNLRNIPIIWASLIAQLVKNPPAMQEAWI